MNFLSGLLRSKPNAEKVIVTISPGELSIVRPEDSPKGRRELIYKDAEISLVKTTREFFVNIQVQDLNNDKTSKGEDEGEIVDLESEADTTYLVHPEIKLGYYLKNGRVAITWRDLTGENGEQFEFLCAESVSKDTLDKFDRAACEAQYGQKYGKKAPADAPESLFDEFTTEYDNHGLVKIDDDAIAAGSTGEAPAYPLTEGRIMTKQTADLCLYDKAKNYFVSLDANRSCDVVVIDEGEYNYFLEVRKENKAIMGVPVDKEFSPYIDVSHSALIFNCELSDKALVSYLLRFTSTESLKEFDHTVSVAKYEASNKQRWQDLSTDVQDFLSDAMTNMDIEQPDEDYSEWDEAAAESEAESEAEEEVTDDYSEYPDNEVHDINSALEVGHTNDRTFVVRGDKIGVFKNTDRSVQYNTTIKGLDFDPSKIMLHEQDRALVLQNDAKPDYLYRMDLETGKIVDEWKTGKEVLDLNPVSKFAQTTAEQNLFGVDQNSMFRIDPRVNGGKVASDAEKKYKTSNIGLSNIVTTEAGWIVVGNDKGEVRLFNQLGKNATTLIPGLGDPILGLDVSSDGKFVLVTCARYLLLIETATKDNNGFTRKWMKDSRPMPRKLEISPENVAYMRMSSQKPLKFTPAKFNMSTRSKETTIVTSTGPYLVTWNLSAVLKGDRDSYRVKVYDGNITANNFKFGTDQRVILALEDNVNIVAKSALKKPSDIFKEGTRR